MRDQKCPSMFFILCGYIEHGFIYKIAQNILMGFNIWCQVGDGVTLFLKLPYSHEFSNILFHKRIFFEGYYRQKKCERFFENFINLIALKNWILKFRFWNTATQCTFQNHTRTHLSYRYFRVSTYSVPSESREGFTREARRAEMRSS